MSFHQLRFTFLILTCVFASSVSSPSLAGIVDQHNPDGWDGPGWDGPGWDGPGWDGPGWEGPGSEGPGSEGPGWSGPGSEGPGWEGPGWDGPGWEGPGSDGPGWSGPSPEGPGWEGPGLIPVPGPTPQPPQPKPSPGSGSTTVTWSYLESGVNSPAGDRSHSGRSSNIGLFTRGNEFNLFNRALSVWGASSGLSNQGRKSASGSSDIHITMGAYHFDGPQGVLAHATVGGSNPFVHFDSEEDWSNNSASGSIDFFTVALHELGHALGLGHSSDKDSIMYASYQGKRRTLGADDIARIRAIHGGSVSAIPGLSEPDIQGIPEPESSLLALLGLLFLLLTVRGIPCNRLSRGAVSHSS